MPKTSGTAPGNEKPYHHGALRAQLLVTARALLRKRGLAQLSMREVAREAGVSKNAPYRHFADREELLRELATAGFVKLRRSLEAARVPDTTAQAPGGQKLQGMGRAYVRFAARNRELYRLMFSLPVENVSDHPDLARESGRAYQVLAATVEAGFESGEFCKLGTPQRSVTAAWAYVHGLASLVIDRMIDERAILNDAELEVLSGAMVSGL